VLDFVNAKLDHRVTLLATAMVRVRFPEAPLFHDSLARVRRSKSRWGDSALSLIRYCCKKQSSQECYVKLKTPPGVAPELGHPDRRRHPIRLEVCERNNPALVVLLRLSSAFGRNLRLSRDTRISCELLRYQWPGPSDRQDSTERATMPPACDSGKITSA